MWRVLIVLFGAFPMFLHAETLPVKNGDFAKPKKGEHQTKWLGDGFEISKGEADSSLRWIAPKPWNEALLLKPSGAQRVNVTFPEIDESKAAKDGWYGVVSMDVLGLDASGKASVSLRVFGTKKERVLAKCKSTFNHIAATAAEKDYSEQLDYSASHRIWLRISAEDFLELAGKTAIVEFEVNGKCGVVLDNLRLERFHEQPSRKLLGKPNGKLGPDFLGAGAMGFDGLTEHLNTAFSILSVRKDSPADKSGLLPGDLVVAIDGIPLWESSIDPGDEWFQRSHEAMCGRAVLAAYERKKKKGIVLLTVLREKGTKELKLKLGLPGALSETFPYDDKFTDRLHADVLNWTVTHQKADGTWPGQVVVNTTLAALTLMATRDRKYKVAIDKAVQALMQRNPDPTKIGGFTFWPLAFQGILLCEYYLATGDKEALAWIKAACEWLPTVTHECKWGMQAFGHGPKGLPYDEKALMAPASHLLLFDALACKCGVKSRIWESIKEYVVHSWSDPKKGGHGGMGYNASYKDKNEFWSRSGLTALSLKLREDKENVDMQNALVGFMESRHQWMLNSHAYGEPGASLGLISLAVVDEDKFKSIMPQWRWRFMNAWEPGYGLRWSTPHMGSPYMGTDEIMNPAYGLVLAASGKGLAMLGGEAKRWLVSANQDSDGAWCADTNDGHNCIGSSASFNAHAVVTLSMKPVHSADVIPTINTISAFEVRARHLPRTPGNWFGKHYQDSRQRLLTRPSSKIKDRCSFLVSLARK